MPIRAKNIFITGATGFIGRRLTNLLSEENNIVILARPSSKIDFPATQNIKVIYGDLLNNLSYVNALKSADYVFHLAGLFKVDAPKDELYKINVLGVKALLEVCCECKNIKRVIHFSTAVVSGINESERISEDVFYPEKYRNYYEWSKVEGEKAALEFYHKRNLPIVIVRPAIVYGPGNAYGLKTAIDLLKKRKLLAFPGNGSGKVHLVHVEDVARASIFLAEIENVVAGSIYHICDDECYTSLELVRFVCDELNLQFPKVRIPKIIVKLITKTYLVNYLFPDFPVQLIDYFMYNHSYSNKKIRALGYRFQHTPLSGLKESLLI